MNTELVPKLMAMTKGHELDRVTSMQQTISMFLSIRNVMINREI